MSTSSIKTPLKDRNQNASPNNRQYYKSRELKDILRKFNIEKDRADDLETEIKSKDGVIKKLREELDSCKRKIRCQNDEMANTVSLDIYEQLKLDVEEIKEKHGSLLGDFKFAQTRIKDLEDELSSSWNSNQELSVKYESAVKDMENIAKEFVDYIDLKSKYQTMQQRFDSLLSENAELKKHLKTLEEKRREEMFNESSVCIPLNMDATFRDLEPVSLFAEISVKDSEKKFHNEQVETLTSQLSHTINRLSDSYLNLKSCIIKSAVTKKKVSYKKSRTNKPSIRVVTCLKSCFKVVDSP